MLSISNIIIKLNFRNYLYSVYRTQILFFVFFACFSAASCDVKDKEPFFRQDNFLTSVAKIYKYKNELENTRTFQTAWKADTFLLSPLYVLYTKGPMASIMGLAQQASYSSPDLVSNTCLKLVNRFMPEPVRDPCQKFISRASYVLSGYLIYNHCAEFLTSNLLGLTGAYMAHKLLSGSGVESSYQKEYEAFSYYMLKKAGWVYASDFFRGISDLLSFMPQQVLTFMFGEELENLPVTSGLENTLTAQCSLDVIPDECETDTCQIETGWIPLKECVQSYETGEYFNNRWQECRTVLEKNVPNFNRDISDELYSEVNRVGSGGSNVVLRTRPKEGRSLSGIKSTDEIVVRVSPGITEMRLDFDAYSRLDMVRPYTNIFTNIYGAYFARAIDKLNFWYVEFFPDRHSLYVEMEYVPYSFSEKIGNKNYVTDSVLFELCIGEWAQKVIGGVYIDDYKRRHFGYKISDALRLYEIGEKFFLINNPIVPKRMDYDGTYSLPLECSVETAYDLCPALSLFELSSSLKGIFENNKNLGLFEFLFKAFKKYEIALEDAQGIQRNNSLPIEHYKLPEEYLPRDVFN